MGEADPSSYYREYLSILLLFSLSPSPPPPPSLSLPHSCTQDLYGVRSDLGNLYKALGRLEDAKVKNTTQLV